MSDNTKRSGHVVAIWFFGFFLTFICVDAVFVYLAISTQTGVVSDKAYEKGLAYNQYLDAAQSQDQIGIQQSASYADGTLTWVLKDKDGQAITNAIVVAKMIRPVQDGHDFEVNLIPSAPGIYQVKLDTPLPGAWTAKLKASWNTTQYRTTFRLTAS